MLKKKHILFAMLPLLLISCTAQKNQTSDQPSTLNHQNMQTISTLHDPDKAVSAQPLFQGAQGMVAALQIKQDSLLKEHVTKVEALLVCVSGEVIYENEKGVHQILRNGGYVRIEPMVKHWVKGLRDSQLLLIK